MRLKPIEQQVVVIVGTASGIGRETAHLFAARGARLVLADNDEAGLQSLSHEIRDRGGSAVPVVADVADQAQVATIAGTAVRSYGGFDTWVQVAAVAMYANFTDTSPEEFQRVVQVNLMGQVFGANAALPHLARAGGALIHVSSIEAKRAFPYHSAYAASKHGIDGFLETLRLELKHQKIPVSVTQIMPASINTPLFDKAETKLGVKSMGMPPFYEPRAVAEAILYAAEHEVRDIVVGGAGKALLWTQRLSPGLLDAILLRVAFRAQKTGEPRSAHAPNNLFGPAGTYNRVEGDFGAMTLGHSLSTWWDTHPGAKTAAMLAAAIGAGAILSTRGNNPSVLDRARASTIRY